MRTLRDVREVAELWLCDRFIPAFHFVFGWPQKTKPIYKAIRRAGALLPAAEVGRLGLFVFDVLAGDDKYNFLSLGRPMGIADPICYGFVFDAEQLVTQGALLGAGDLLPYYDKVARAIIQGEGFDSDQIHVLGRTKFSPESIRKFVNYESGRSWGESERKPLRDYLPVLIQAFHDLQSEHRFAGRKALGELHAWAGPVCAAMHEALEKTASYMRGGGDFEEHYARMREHFPDWSVGTSCKSAARDTYYFKHHEIIPWPLRAPPELLWPGRLPLSKAVAAFELPCKTNGHLSGTLDWPDDIFSLLCPRK